MKYSIAIVGSSHAPAEVFIPYVRSIVLPFVGLDGFSLLSGGATGADTAARIVAKELGVPIVEHLPDLKKHARYIDAFRERNKLIASQADDLYSLAVPCTKRQCIHCKRVGKIWTNHEQTGGCWTGSMKGKWNVVICTA